MYSLSHYSVDTHGASTVCQALVIRQKDSSLPQFPHPSKGRATPPPPQGCCEHSTQYTLQKMKMHMGWIDGSADEAGTMEAPRKAWGLCSAGGEEGN